jgi:hypothetical protein
MRDYTEHREVPGYSVYDLRIQDIMKELVEIMKEIAE